MIGNAAPSVDDESTDIAGSPGAICENIAARDECVPERRASHLWRKRQCLLLGSLELATWIARRPDAEIKGICACLRRRELELEDAAGAAFAVRGLAGFSSALQLESSSRRANR